MRRPRNLLLVLVASLSFGLPQATGQGEPEAPKPAAPADRSAAITATAVAGRPLGVCKLSIPHSLKEAPGVRWTYATRFADLEELLGWRVRTAEDRALYVAVHDGRQSMAELEKAIEAARNGAPVQDPTTAPATGRARVLYFLFVGKDELRLTVSGPNLPGQNVVVQPVDGESSQHKKLLKEWWETYTANAERAGYTDAYPPIVETYLTTMLARRLNLKAPDIGGYSYPGTDGPMRVFGLLLGTESVRMAMQRDALLSSQQGEEKADQPMPKAALPPVVAIPPFPGDVAFEPIAARVPEECFYLRTGSFSNFRWLRNVLDTWGAALRDGFAFRAVDYQFNQRLQRQIAIKETAVSRLLGPAVIADVAVIGTDVFFREGAGMGLLFQAKNNTLLESTIKGHRSDARKADPAVTEATVKIGGRDVLFLSRPDNAVRSFYAVDGDYHLVTTSRYIVERFFEASGGKRRLSDLKEFRYARSQIPLARNDVGFLYLSDPFFRQLVCPHDRVEMTRRAASLAEMEVLEMARLAAASEGKQARTAQELIQGGYLPAAFSRRSDGSALEGRDGALVDTLRGGRGTFIPVADVEIKGLTRSEVKAYEEFLRDYQRLWTSMDPVFIGLGRADGPNKTQHLTLDIHISPYVQGEYGMFRRYLGRPVAYKLAPVAGDLFRLDLLLSPDVGGLLTGEPATRPSPEPGNAPRLFLGLQDFGVPIGIKACDIDADESEGWRNTRLYVGQFQTAMGRFLFGHEEKKPDAQGYIRPGTRKNPKTGKEEENPWELWQRKLGEFHVGGSTRELLEAVSPQLTIQPAQRPAQIRLRIEDLNGTRLYATVNAAAYTHARKISAGNTMLMASMIQQLNMPPQTALATAERLLNARLVCPLGGQYQWSPRRDQWVSSAWKQPMLADVDRVPADFKSPLLDFFRRVDLEFTIGADHIYTHTELDVKPPKE